MAQSPSPHKPTLRRMLQLCVALCVAALLSACASPSAQTPVAPEPADLKLVMIGDSYSALVPDRGVTYPWPEQVRDAWGLSDEDCSIYRHGGYGFGLPSGHFVDLVADVSPDPDVTHVIVLGGAGNDRGLPKEEALKWYRATFDRLRELYPNATLMHTVTSWDLKDTSYQAKILERIPWYEETAAQMDVVFLHGCETVLRDHPEYFLPDGRHPNQAGQEAMGAAVIEALRATGTFPA